MSDFIFKASLRQDMGKGASRRLRREGLIPAVVYGADKEAVSIVLNHNEALTVFRNEDVYSSIVTVEIDGKPESAILRDVQRHPYKPLLAHLDFLRVKAGEKLKSMVPVVLLNAEDAAGVKAGGVLTHALTAIEVECLPKDLPHAIEIDIIDLAVGAHITVADVKAPAGVEILTPAEDQVAGILAPRIADDAEEATDAAEATEEA
ncbi:50S ribosomal protein L25/general stress protein Ctc [Wohlfahrtiimonas chitiniclastica]|uniref:50S ribosomal protein L25/general stress protein Ctc n=1 Tax=Wohlfahrtiimonas chitiniclastica TaxID=400946 RepID=UPI001BD13F06|nr:50S ribosomal protein L25/general stress protein Ctc [Wohlfahrtiimonas chitiniclastica]MBS7826825.1 50S ribosomal protein L25/general stress protein Ctc [Wohlfahrtiimonas chitiniclastica]